MEREAKTPTSLTSAVARFAPPCAEAYCPDLRTPKPRLCRGIEGLGPRTIAFHAGDLFRAIVELEHGDAAVGRLLDTIDGPDDADDDNGFDD